MWGSRRVKVATTAVGGLALLAGFAPAALAQEGEDSGRPDRPRLTDEQRACLQEQGLEKPAKDENGERVPPTDEQRAVFRAAAEACGIPLPPARRLTEEQRACLQEQGLEKPATDENGERVPPTEEQRAAFRTAAEACGIELPPARPDGPPSDAPAEGS